MDDGGEQAVSRLHYVRRMVIGLAAIGTLGSVSSALTNNWLGATIAGGAAVVLVALLLRAMRKNAIGAISHALGVTLWLGATALIVFSGGGVGAPAVFVYPIIPVMMAFLLGSRAAMYWAGVTSVSLLVVLAAGDLVPPARLDIDAARMLNVATPIASIILIALTALAYEQAQNHHVANAEASRAEALEARKAAEAAMQEADVANRAKSAFLATMSHEIRTPLTAVVGVAEVLRGAGLDARHARQLSLLEGAGRTLLGLVDDILDLSRIESGQLDIESQPVDLAALVQDIGQILQTRAATRGIALHHSHEGPAMVLSDPLRLRQILLNLVGNAVKFTEDGEVALTSTVTRRTEDGRLDVVLVVRDTGVGIPKDRQAAVFQPFTQAEQGTARRFGGSGLGLSIVARLVEMMGGTISLVSAPGKGTTVTVRIVLSPAAGPVAEEPGEQAPEGNTRRVLLAEDNEINQEVVRLMLERCDCQVTIAPDGFQAVSAVVDAPDAYDLILMDCQMPGMDGFEATRTLRAAGWTRPIVALTANATPADRAECIAAGMDGFTSKPLTLADLRGVLTRYGPKAAEPAPTERA